MQQNVPKNGNPSSSISMYISIFVYLPIYLFVSVYIYTYIYIHTSTSPPPQAKPQEAPGHRLFATSGLDPLPASEDLGFGGWFENFGVEVPKP